MGRDCGYLALGGRGCHRGRCGLASREEPGTHEGGEETGTPGPPQPLGQGQKRRVLMLKAEGVKIPTETLLAELSGAVADMKHVEVTVTVLGHIVR